RVGRGGLRQLVVAVADDNAGAARLYLRLGYVDTGRIVESRYRYPDETGRLVDIVEYNRRLVKDLSAGPSGHGGVDVAVGPGQAGVSEGGGDGHDGHADRREDGADAEAADSDAAGQGAERDR